MLTHPTTTTPPRSQRALDEPYEQQVILDSKGRPRRALRLQYINYLNQRHISGAVGTMGESGGGGGPGASASGDLEVKVSDGNVAGAGTVTAEWLADATARKRHTDMEAARTR